MAPQSGQTVTNVTASSTYDDLGRVTSVNDPDSGNHTLTYDPDGHLLTDVSGSRTIGANYDLLGRVGCVQDAAPTINATGACTSGTNPYVQNTYDTTVLGTQGLTDFPVGRLTQSVATTYYPDSTSATVTQQAQYDQRGRPILGQMTLTWPGSWGVTTPLPTYQLSTSYNDADQPTTITTSTNPAGQGYTTTNVYDSTSGALIGLSNTSSANANVATLTFTPRAQINTVTYLTTAGTGLSSEQFGYDANLRPTSASATWLSGSGSSGTILSQSRTYDSASNVTSLSTTLAAVPGASGSGGSETQNFCYDEQNRLVWAGNSGSQPLPGNGTCGTGTLANTLQNAGYGTSYVYTHLGQLWQGPQSGSSTPSQYLYCDSSHPHQLTGLYTLGSTCSNKQGQTYTSSYDAWGNVTGRTVTSTSATLSYDGLDHLTTWDAGSTGQEQYIYDASGERVLRRSTSAGNTTMTVYAFGLEEHRYNGSGVNQGNTYYYSLGGMLVGEFDGTNTNMFLTDALGSVIETISAAPNSATVQGNQVYGPYGTSRYQQGSMGTTKGFTGQYSDSLTGLDYYGARYYDPVVGRFLSADALGGLDPYAYVGGNPETSSDPTGHIPCASDGVGPCGGSPSPPPGNKPKPAVAGAAVIPTDSTSGSNDYNLCPGGQKTTDCVATQLQAITSQDVDVSVPLTGGPGPGGLGPCLYTLGGIGGCGLLPGGGSGFQIKIRSHVNSITPVDFCPNPTACAFAEEMAKDLAGGEGAKGTEESNDTGFGKGGKGGLAEDLAAIVGGKCSFTSTTEVTTDHGQQAIGTLQVGERVLAYNPKTHKMEMEPILHVWINHDSDLVNLTITTTKGSHGHSTKTSEVVHTNQKHPFFTMEQGFLPVGQITLGMHLLRADGRVGVVTGWQVVPGTKVMYNLEVAQDHTYTVGAGQYVVHNANCNPVARAKAIEILRKLRKAGADVSHTVIGVGILPDDSMLVAVNDRYTGIDNTQALIDLLKSDYPNATYVGPNGLLPKGVPRDWAAHAENYVQMYALTNDLELQGIGVSLKAGPCPECSIFIRAFNPNL